MQPPPPYQAQEWQPYTYQAEPHQPYTRPAAERYQAQPYDRPISNQDGDVVQPSDQSTVSEALRWMNSIPEPRRHAQLQRPIAIPQIDRNSLRSGPMPFMRAYAPCLMSNDITVDHFLAFVDNLTVAQAPSPPFQGLQLVGAGIGFVPHHWAQAASAGIRLAAGAGTAAVSAARTKMYLKGANEGFFNPRGLKVSIVSSDELDNLLQRIPDAIQPFGAGIQTSGVTVAERRVGELVSRGKIAELIFDVPPPTEQTNLLDRLSAKQVQGKMKKNRKKAIKEQDKIRKDREKEEGRISSSSASSIDGWSSSGREQAVRPVTLKEDLEAEKKLKKLELKLQKVNLKAEQKLLSEEKSSRSEKDRAKEARKIEKDRAKETSEIYKEMNKIQRERESKTREREAKVQEIDAEVQEKETKAVAKLKWIVVENLRS
ncbi:hypothetical protein DV736_g6474, partial [Chaetothyriales sp. CBS 134916]